MTEEIGNKMDLQKFILRHPFLYHLSDARNLSQIVKEGKLYSSVELAEKSSLDDEDKKKIILQRRPTHKLIPIEGVIYYIRDQRPVSEKNLLKCLTPGWTLANFYLLINSRVFFWPTVKRLESHFSRYRAENPVIIRVSTEEILKINQNAEFCRLNSGATRSSSYLDGAPPVRGDGTFLSADQYDRSVSSVAEVTFPGSCILSKAIFVGNTPNGPWEKTLIELDYSDGFDNDEKN